MKEENEKYSEASEEKIDLEDKDLAEYSELVKKLQFIVQKDENNKALKILQLVDDSFNAWINSKESEWHTGYPSHVEYKLTRSHHVLNDFRENVLNEIKEQFKQQS